MEGLKHADLIINADGSIYHLGLRPEDIADTIILVGDPQRVAKVSKHFDEIEFTKASSSLITISMLSTPIPVAKQVIRLFPTRPVVLTNSLFCLVNSISSKCLDTLATR